MPRWMRRLAPVAGGMTFMASFGRGVALLVAAGASVPLAHAQEGIKAVDPYIVVVTVDKAPLRCSNGAALFYAVRELKAGELLRVNGEGPGWLRIEYTPGMRAFVLASDADADREGKSARLNKPSRLLAVSADNKNKWWPLDLDADLPAGTSLRIVDTIKTADSVIEGYLVEAPPRARGFVKAEHARRATPEEASKYVGSNAAPAKPAETTKPAETAPRPTEHAVAPAPTASNPAPAGTPEGFNPVTPVATQPATPSATVPADPAATPVEPTPTVTMTNQAPVVPPPPPPPKKDQELEEIRAMFDKVMATGGDAELPTVIGMFERKIAKLGSDTKDQLIKRSLAQRLEALKLRQEILQQREAARQMTVTQQQSIQRVSLIVAEAQKQAIYNIVGRIQPSTVYDGQRGLPLMYRVESADALSPRTVGYIIPTDGIDLLTKIGKVCGVLGETRFDASLGLNIVAPRRIDVLDVGATSTSPPGVFPSAPASSPEAPAAAPTSEPATTSAPAEPEK